MAKSAEFDAQALGEIGEATGQMAVRSPAFWQLRVIAGAGESSRRSAENPGETRASSPAMARRRHQAFAVVIDFTAHRGFDHSRDFFLLAGKVGQFVDASSMVISVESMSKQIRPKSESFCRLGEGPVELRLR